MALREFEDANGVTWRVWDTNPDILSGLTQEMQRGWLTFDSGSERRRLSPIPTGWIDMPPERLRLLAQIAIPLRLRSNTPTPRIERRTGERRIAERRAGERRRTGDSAHRPA